METIIFRNVVYNVRQYLHFVRRPVLFAVCLCGPSCLVHRLSAVAGGLRSPTTISLGQHSSVYTAATLNRAGPHGASVGLLSRWTAREHAGRTRGIERATRFCAAAYNAAVIILCPYTTTSQSQFTITDQ